MTTVGARPVYESLDDLIAELAAGRPVVREPFDKNADSLSGAPFEALRIGGERYVVKHIAYSDDWIMRALGDGAGGTPPWALVMWRSGLLDQLPADIDHAVVGMAYDSGLGRLAQVMVDVGEFLVPADPTIVPLDQHGRFIDHMAHLHAEFWGTTGSLDLMPEGNRWAVFHPSLAQREATGTDAVPKAVPGGWEAVRRMHPASHAVAMQLTSDPSPLARAMAATPRTFVHGDWKFGNLGSRPDGRTILLDWAWPGVTGACVDLAWYLAVNCDRLPESKEETIEQHRAGLVRYGVDVGDWYDRQLDLALLGAFLQLGWSKPGNPLELMWWTDRAVRTAATL
jgi:hypothetical protein